MVSLAAGAVSLRLKRTKSSATTSPASTSETKLFPRLKITKSLATSIRSAAGPWGAMTSKRLKKITSSRGTTSSHQTAQFSEISLIKSLVFLLIFKVAFAHQPRKNSQNCNCAIRYKDTNHYRLGNLPLLDCIPILHLNDAEVQTTTELTIF